MKKRIAVLGATGSIGKSALDIISRDRENLEVVLLSAHSNSNKLDELKNQFPDAKCILTSPDLLGDKDLFLNAVKNANVDLTINGISGAAGLEPSVAAIEGGSNLALANKETIVMAGKLVLQLAKEKNVKIIPVDSEHSAVFHLLQYFSHKEHKGHEELVSEIVLTASGGPFKNLGIDEMQDITVQDALIHPTWNMGKKITIDSATMANKGLEVIEACVFFDTPADKIKVVIHPQSIVHSMIRLCNGVFYAQLSKPDMRHPIHDALYWPQTTPSALELLCFDSLTLEFSKPDLLKFPMLDIAYSAAKLGGLYPTAYNAANEVAVASFLEQKCGFLDISMITSRVMDSDWTGNSHSIEAILKIDADARLKAKAIIQK
ncbi:MAG: 1-deoxy-D-xylulose-5-phosphate reductoisomerase [Treponema sp.]|jgi:1-deoxy-D-xylulose-5-phosphate reductoisomerase|nr:1-deoxy-D-xylulose-5-phosphate reductoisomerase [Treponema sp.]